MDEEAVAAKVRQNIPANEESPAPVKTEPSQGGQPSDFTGAIDIDEMTLYKLHDYFGEQYSPYNTEAVNQAKYIYEAIAGRIGSIEYQEVLAAANSLIQIIGLGMSERKMNKLYQWLRLDGVRRKVEAEMGTIHG